MRKFCYLIIATICLYACGSVSNEVEIKGQIKGLQNDTIYVYGDDELSDLVDFIVVKEDKISHTIPLDTLLKVVLIMDNAYEYPLYLDKGKKVSIKGDLEQSEFLEVKGVAPNDALTAFNKKIKELPEASTDSIIKSAEEFILLNQTSLISIYLLDKYFVQQQEPDLAKIKELISFMDGTLQDKPYIENLSALIEQAEKAETGKSSLSFSLPNDKGEKINRTKFRNKYLLINFWASWCDSCQTTNTELREIYKKYKKEEKFAMLGISLDMDKTAWRKTIKNDTLEWEQVCDFMGWDNTVVQQYGVYNIPYNILLGTDGRVLVRDIKGEALTGKLEELLKVEKKK